MTAAIWQLTVPAQAQVWGGYGMGMGLPYSVYVQDQIPYFAAHPPVYYSRPVARTYGYSPFPYPPFVMTPRPEVLFISHNLADGLPSAMPQEGTKAPVEPLVIVNPYLPQTPDPNAPPLPEPEKLLPDGTPRK